jgi:hypothetical protein
MIERDSRCQSDDQIVLNDVSKYGWRVIIVPDEVDLPGRAFSIGLFKTWRHPEITTFGLKNDGLHSMINRMAKEVQSGNQDRPDQSSDSILEACPCIFKKASFGTNHFSVPRRGFTKT